MKHVNPINQIPFHAVATIGLAILPVQAAVIYTEDFEGTGIADGDFTPSSWPGTDFTTSATNGANLLNPAATGGSSAWLSPVPPLLGEIFGVIHSGTTQQADLTTLQFADNTTYTLSFTHFRRDDLAGDGVTAQIWAVGGSSPLATDTFAAITTTDTFVSRSVSFTTSGGSEVGQNIQLRLIDPTGGGNIPQAGIDNITLDATVVPEPSATGLAVVGLVGLLGIRRRRK